MKVSAMFSRSMFSRTVRVSLAVLLASSAIFVQAASREDVVIGVVAGIATGIILSEQAGHHDDGGRHQPRVDVIVSNGGAEHRWGYHDERRGERRDERRWSEERRHTRYVHVIDYYEPRYAEHCQHGNYDSYHRDHHGRGER